MPFPLGNFVWALVKDMNVYNNPGAGSISRRTVCGSRSAFRIAGCLPGAPLSYHALGCLKISPAHAPVISPVFLSYSTTDWFFHSDRFVKSSRIIGAAHFFVALCRRGRYNSKIRQALKEVSMAGTFALYGILVLHIILALVIITGNQNSAPGHARRVNTAPGFRRKSR